MIGYALAFLTGALFASVLPESFRVWVRATAGAARDRVFGARPARAAPVKLQPETHLSADLVEFPQEPASNAQGNAIWTGAANVGRFFAGLLGWIVKHPMLAIGIIVLAAFLLFGAPSCSPFGDIGKPRGQIICERNQAERTLENTREVSEAASEEGERFRGAANVIEDELARGNEALESVAREADTVSFLTVWRDADQRLRDLGGEPG